MRRKVSLYIGGLLADIDDQGLILYNYAFTDVESPAAVKNSYSKQITLPGTPANDAIFGHFARPDRRTAPGLETYGPAFNPGRKTPFDIYDEAGQVIECGYVRLDAVIRKGAVVTGYKVSLFGGLGEFFANLTYNENGDKMTLADLDYLGTGNTDSELDFTINATAVLAAWARVKDYPIVDPAQKWDVINFAPCYNGAPDGDFSPNKGIVVAPAVGLDTSVQDGDKTYEVTASGKTLVNLPSAVDEWAAKDLRSYLQRPVISMRAILKAIADPANNGGYAVDYSAVPARYYKRIWKTLPMLTSLGSGRKIVGEASLVNSGDEYASGSEIGRMDVDGTIPQGMKTTAKVGIIPWMYLSPSDSSFSLDATWTDVVTNKKGSSMIAYFFQVVAYNGSTAIGASNIKVIAARVNWNWKQIAEDAGVVFEYPGVGFETPVANVPQKDGLSYAYFSPMDFEVSTNFPPTKYKVFVHCLRFSTYYTNGMDASGGETFRNEPYETDMSVMDSVLSGFSYHTALKWWVQDNLSAIAYESGEGIRSGSQVTKALLLQSKYSPAEYLISWAKMFGLVFLCNQKEKRITIMPRNDFFNTGEAVIDLTEKIDRSRDITISPMNITSKWYEMRAEMAEGAFAQEYKALYGVDFGIQRIDTGYDFDSSVKNIMEGYVFRQAVTKVAHGRYWEMIFVGGGFRPSPFLDKGVTYTLWEQATQEAKTFPVPGIPATATVQMYNINRDYYDIEETVLRLELADKDGKPVDGEDILVFYWSGTNYAYFKVSDDSAEMIALNDGTPCWDLMPGSPTGIRVPTFSMFSLGDGPWEYNIDYSLYFGAPREVDIPECRYTGGSLYECYWRQFLRDRLSTDTKVMKCRVNLRGLQAGPELLRRFFWYDNSLWVLNKITNHSLTTWDPVECEFVQVQDPDNYIEGQIVE